MRNLGGSFGISLAQTALAEFSQRHQFRLVEHLTPYDLAYREALPRIAETSPESGYMMEAMISSIAQADIEAKTRIRDFLEKRAAKVGKTKS